MYKRALGVLTAVLLLLLGCCGMFGFPEGELEYAQVSLMKLDAACLADGKSSAVGMAAVAASGQRVVGFQVMEKEPQPGYALPEKDYEVLLRIVEAEAGGEDAEGRLLVANVVLNRMDSPRFPGTVSEVVFQRAGGVTQFSPVATGSIWSVAVSEETAAAVDRALRGEDLSQGALFFAARKYADSEKMRWFDENLVFLFRHGGHEFFR